MTAKQATLRITPKNERYIAFSPGGSPINIVLRQWKPFHIPSLVRSIPFNCCKCTFSKTWIKIAKHELFHSHIKMHLSLLDLFRERNDWFPDLSTYSNKWNPYLTISFTWSLHEKDQARYPFRAEPTRKTPKSTCYFYWSGLISSYVLRHIRLRSFAVFCG